MRKLIGILLLMIAISADAQDMSLYEKHWYVSGSDTLPYRVLLPENYDASKKYPLIFFLHGAGERGNDNEKQLVHGAKLFLRDSIRKKYPAIIVFPQCPANSYWSNVQITTTEDGKRMFFFMPDGEPTTGMKLAQELLHKILKGYAVNKSRVYIGGLSMGGMGTFELVRRDPGLFAAAFPICGGANPATASKLKKTKWWIFHGAKDDVVLPENSEMMVRALKKAKASVKFTLYPDANHNSWDPAFAEPGLLSWLFAQRKK
ncbi:MAG TPA: prolyl oligopeptidase family serine peptidase [Chitinophagaceae bacterium]